MNIDKLKSFRFQIESELKMNILKFWIDNTVDEENGGFYGFVSKDLIIGKTHDRASVLYSRILWTFSKAYSVYKDEKYLFMATRAYNYINSETL